MRRAGLVGLLAVGVVVMLVMVPPSRLLGSMISLTPDSAATVEPGARGLSGEVRLQTAMPGAALALPVRLPTATARYQWVRASDSVAVAADTVVAGGPITAPRLPGLYHLALVDGDRRQVLGDLVLGVLMPFSEKLGGSLNGYRIGTYKGERSRDPAETPPGFIEVWPADANLWVSDHLQLADFITHDAQQDRWPKYVALDRRMLDKVELVLDRLGAHQRLIAVDVHSGFRTPLYNRRVPRAASDSRHQYGDAIDLALDADQDGRVSFFDILAVARAVEAVELEHPELVGGMGVYGNRGNAPYVHIDVRGERKRWRG